MPEWIMYVTQPKAMMIAMVALMVIMEISRGYFRELGGYVRNLPLRRTGVILSVGAAAVLSVIAADAQILGAVRSIGPDSFPKKVLIDFGGYLGKFFGLWLILGALYVFFSLLRFRHQASCFFSAALSSALSGGLAHGIKHIAQRARPYTEEGPFRFFDFHGFSDNARAYQSFPSGDVAVVAGAAAFLFLYFQGKPWRWIFMFLPVLTALSRVWNNKHWPSDTLFSLAVGFAAASLVAGYRSYEESRRNAQS